MGALSTSVFPSVIDGTKWQPFVQSLPAFCKRLLKIPYGTLWYLYSIFYGTLYYILYIYIYYNYTIYNYTYTIYYHNSTINKPSPEKGKFICYLLALLIILAMIPVFALAVDNPRNLQLHKTTFNGICVPRLGGK